MITYLYSYGKRKKQTGFRKIRPENYGIAERGAENRNPSASPEFPVTILGEQPAGNNGPYKRTQGT